MQALSESLLPVLVQLAAVALTAIVVAARTGVSTWLRGHVKNQTAQAAAQRLNEAVWSVVEEVEQTVAKEMRRNAADGKLTEAERRHLAAIALQRLKEEIGDWLGLGKLLGWDAGRTVINMQGRIESAVSTRKLAAKASALPLDVPTAGIIGTLTGGEP